MSIRSKAVALALSAISLALVAFLRRDVGRSSQSADSLIVRVLVLNFDPLIASAENRRLHEVLDWHDPKRLATDYIADVAAASGGFVRYEIVEWRDTHSFHRKADGFLYTADEYLKNYRSGSGWHQPDGADYRRTFADYDVLPRLARREIDELWFFGGPYFGYHESAMAGPGAFDVNGEVFADVPAARAFAIMGFNYERGVAEMLENLCHRVESTMSRIYGGWRADALDHAWAQFAANQAQSGTAAVGSCHWPPNAGAEYDFSNERTVASTGDDWLAYPHLTGRRKPVNRETWGGPEYARNYFRWWFAHLPRKPGTGSDGRENNWWKYVFDFNRYDDRGVPRR
jgi:hypothetical protein